MINLQNFPSMAKDVYNATHQWTYCQNVLKTSVGTTSNHYNIHSSNLVILIITTTIWW